MPNEDQMKSVRYRLGKAQQCAATAKNILFDGDYEASIDRSYHAFFHGMRAMIVLGNLNLKEISSAADVLERFEALYIRTGLFDGDFSKTIKAAFDLYFDCMYEDFFVVSKTMAEQQMKAACVFLEKVEYYIAKHKISV